MRTRFPVITPQTIGEVLGEHDSVEILNLFNRNQVVRRLHAHGTKVLIDAITVTVLVPFDTPITYEPWFMDRGSLLFSTPEAPDGKLCTEMDYVRYPDGRIVQILPHPSLQGAEA